MDRSSKCELAIKRGFTYNEINGLITGPSGKTCRKTSKNGYILLTIRDDSRKAHYLYGHQFAWYFKHREIVPLLDHINRIKIDNRISNLRSITKQQNAFNTASKGCSFENKPKKWSANIMIGGKKKFLGYYDTKEEAELKYKQEKSKHHLIE